MSLRPDHDAKTLRALMERFNSAAQPVSPAEQANQIKQQLAESADQGVTEAYQFKGDFPFDVDHMPGAVIRDADSILDNIKTQDKAYWERAVNSVNARVFDDMSEFRTDSRGETVIGNSAVWAKWDDATQTGWFNHKGRPLKTGSMKESGVAEARPDVMRHRGDKTIRVVKRGGKPIGEIGTDSEASPGNGQYYVKLYDGSYDAVGFDSAEEALAELKSAIKQMSKGVAEGSANANETPRSQIIKLYKKGLEDYDIAYDLDIDEKTVADIIDDYDKKQQQQYFKKNGVAEAKPAARKRPLPKFTAYPNYAAWRQELMRRGDDQIDHLDNDYVDNYRVLFAVDRNRRVVGMYYHTADSGSFVPAGQGFSDMIYYADTDPNWPYTGDDGQEDLPEGRAGVDDTDTVGFSVNSEAAYNAVMRRFGDYIDHDETSGIMYVPGRLWPQIEMTAFDADPDSGATRVEDDMLDEAEYGGIDIDMEKDGDEITVRASAGGKQMGHVLFVDSGEYLMPQDLEVDERFRGQGIAAIMYDYVKSQGYKIRRSGQQTDDGAAFWDKNRPGQNVWEQGVAEGLPQTLRKVVPGYAKRETAEKQYNVSAWRTDQTGTPDVEEFSIGGKTQAKSLAQELKADGFAVIKIHPAGSHYKDGQLIKGVAEARVEINQDAPDNLYDIQDNLAMSRWKSSIKNVITSLFAKRYPGVQLFFKNTQEGNLFVTTDKTALASEDVGLYSDTNEFGASIIGPTAEYGVDDILYVGIGFDSIKSGKYKGIVGEMLNTIVPPLAAKFKAKPAIVIVVEDQSAGAWEAMANKLGWAFISGEDEQGVAEGVTSPEIKQAYDAAMKTKPGTPERKRAVAHYQKLRADALAKKKQSGVAEAEETSNKVYFKVINTVGTGMPKGYHRVKTMRPLEDGGFYIELDTPGYGMDYTRHNYKNFSLKLGSPGGRPITGQQAYDIINGEPGVAEGEEQGTFAALKGWQQWNVLIMNNFYNGKYPDYSARMYGVVASSPEEARQVVLDNADYVLKDLLSKKTPNGKRWLPPKSAVPVEDKRVGQANQAKPGSLTTMGFKTMLTPDGPKSMKFSNGQIVDIQGEESAVTENVVPTEKVGSIIKRVLGKQLQWEPGVSKLYKNTRRSRTQRVDDYVMKYISTGVKSPNRLSANSGDAVPATLKKQLIQAGYPVHDDVLIFPDQIMFQVRTPISVTAESAAGKQK